MLEYFDMLAKRDLTAANLKPKESCSPNYACSGLPGREDRSRKVKNDEEAERNLSKLLQFTNGRETKIEKAFNVKASC